MFKTAAVPNFHPSEASLALAYGCLDSLTNRIVAAQQRGDIGVHDDWSPAEMAGWIWATCHGLVTLEVSEIEVPDVSWARSFAHGARTAVTGLLSADTAVAV